MAKTNDFFNFLDSETDSISEHGVFSAMPWLQSLWDDLTGRNAEERDREFQRESWEYNTPANQMARMEAAGINPAAAAAGIAGHPQEANASPSGQSPSAAGSLISDVVNLPNLQADTKLKEAEALNVTATANRTTMLASYERDLLISQIATELEKKGLTHEQAVSAATYNLYLPDMQKVELWLKDAQLQNLKGQYDNLNAQKELWFSEKGYYDVYANKMELENEWYEFYELPWMQRMMERYNINPKDDYQKMMFMARLQGISLQSVYNGIQQEFYNSELGKLNAQVDKQFKVAYNDALGRAAGNAQFEQFLANIDIYKDIIKDMLKVEYHGFPPADILEGLKFFFGLSAVGGFIDVKPEVPTPAPMSNDTVSPLPAPSSNSSNPSYSYPKQWK